MLQTKLQAPSLTLDDLAPLPRWVTWRNEPKLDKPGEYNKSPYNPRNSRKRAETDNPFTWATRAEAQATAKKLVNGTGGGVGIIFGDIGDDVSIGGIDLDTCLGPDGVFTPWATKIMAMFPSYTEISPSGTGAKIFFLYPTSMLETLQSLMGTATGKQFKLPSGDKSHPPGFEFYITGRYFAVTENHLPGTPIELQMILPDAIGKLIEYGCTLTKQGKTKGGSSDGSRSAVALKLGCKLHREGKSYEEMCEALLADPTTAAWAREKGQINDGREFKRIWDKACVRLSERGSEYRDRVEDLNETYALVITGGKTMIMMEIITPKGRPDFTLLSVASFNVWVAKEPPVQIGKRSVSIAQYWLEHPAQRRFNGIVFEPDQEWPNYFNLWKGFAVEPKMGDCSKFLAHIKDNVCHGDVTNFMWIMAWWAAIFQKPREKTGTSVVLKGLEGTGKTIIGKWFGYLLGKHYQLVSKDRYVTGKFNSHMKALLVLHADEGFFAGDHAAASSIKDLITGDEHLIEYKGLEAFTVRNFVRLLISGNENWVVPVGMEGRRMAVFEMSKARMQDIEYFAAIDAEMKNGGAEALLHHLQTMDISAINLRSVPKTTALLDQKLASMTSEQGWWMDVLQRGQLPGGCKDAGKTPSRFLFDDYVAHATKSGARRRSLATILGNELKRFAPGIKKIREMYWLPDQTSERAGVYVFPPLAECRVMFSKLLCQDVSWGEPYTWVDPAEDPSYDGDDEAQARDYERF